MKHSFNRTHLGLAISCALALGISIGPAWAESELISRAYVTDERNRVATSDFGECWHTGTAPPPLEAMIPCEPPVVAPDVAMVAMVTEPAPRMVAVTFDADTLFDFNKAELRPAGREALDTFLGEINGMSPETITAVGHADRIGSDGYNQRLSEQRAQAVKTYLANAGVQPDRIHARGMGEAQPVTRANECEGTRSARVIACLQPDRRVEIQLLGSTEAK